ncbi:hypothetical protein ABW19_dt0208010 [Dactylella cylindrospora]|nr:hypothetical protein ABW19_dt0208010 [Dactylella cylindrospora]
MAFHDYDFDDFLRTSRIGFRLYNNNFREPQNVSPVYRACGDRLLVLSACLQLLHEQGSVQNGLFVGGNIQAQVNKYVPRIGDFRTTIEDLGSLIRENSGGGRPPWEAISGEDLAELEKLSSSMRKQSRSIHNILVLDRIMDVHRALEILGHGAVSPRAVELPASMPEQMTNLVISDDDGRYRNSPNPSRDRDNELVSPISPHVLQMPNQKQLHSIWGDVKYSGTGANLHLSPSNNRPPTQHQDFYGIHRTNSMSNSSDTGRSQSGSSSRNNSTQTLDSPGNSSPAQSPSTYFMSHTAGNNYFRDKDKVRYDDIAQISGMRIQPAPSNRSADSPTNLSSDFSPHSPSSSAVFHNRTNIQELPARPLQIPRRPVSSTSSVGNTGTSVTPNTTSSAGSHPAAAPVYQGQMYDSFGHPRQDQGRQRHRESSVSDGSGGHSDRGRPNINTLAYRRDSSTGPGPRMSELGNTIAERRDSEGTIMHSGHRGSDATIPIRSRQNLDVNDPYSMRSGSRNNSFSIEPYHYLDVPFSPDAISMNLASHANKAASISSKDSKEDNLKPGEVQIFYCKLQSSNTVDGHYDPSELRVYRNYQTDVYRFVTTVLDNPSAPMSHSQYFKAWELELVPEYGYDPQAKPILWLREVDDLNKLKRTLEIMPDRDIPILPAYKFPGVPEMLDFQSAILGEVCYLDIETVRFVRLKGAAKETRRIDNTRVQLWHPPHSDRKQLDDSASFVTVGTTRTHANAEMMRLKWSRMVVYLGRSNDFVTIFVTDDITVRESKKSNTLVFEPTKYTGRALFRSRDGVKAKVVGGGSRKGGLRLDLKGLQPDDEENFPMFKTFEIDFEDAESKIRFSSVWDQLMQERRRMRKVIERRRQLAEERMMMPGGGGN